MMGRLRWSVVALVCVPVLFTNVIGASLPQWSGDAEQVFANPPQDAKPGVWWHWMGCNVTKEGITKDLEAFREAGISSATIFGMADVCTPWAASIANSPTDGLIAYTEPWWKLVRYAAQEGKRLGIDIGVHNCPGYESSGGPWVTPEYSMMEICCSRTVVAGGKLFSGILPKPQINSASNMAFPAVNKDTGALEKPVIEARKTFFRDVAVLAMPAEGVVLSNQMINLTSKMDTDGKLAWLPPEGQWVIYRLGYTTMGTLTQPNQWEARGLECDKMSVEAVEFHMNHVLGDMKKNLGKLVGTGLKHVLFDSYEAGTPSWTPKMPEEFAKRRGYDLTPFLASFAGRVVGSESETTKFRNDFHRTIEELYRDNYFPTVQRLLNREGLRFNCEPYGGPWRVSEAAPHVDRVMSEFWTNGGEFSAPPDGGLFNAGSGKRHNILEAEAFTGQPNESSWSENPEWLKPIGDGALVSGINRLVLHHAVHQPWDDKYRPGIAFGRWGTHFGRLQTWWEPGKAWLKYLSRCQALLQWGAPAAPDMNVSGADAGLAIRVLHRSEAGTDVFFVVNVSRNAGTARCNFKIAGKQPELWDPLTGGKRDLPDYTQAEGRTTVPLLFQPCGSMFIVFRKEIQKLPLATNFPKWKPVQELTGSWEVSFDPAWGGPKSVTFQKLEDWTKREETGIRYYSGTASYEKFFDFPEPRERNYFLDLGLVKHLARVKINGRDLGVVWCAPWGVVIPGKLLKAKGNRLEIEVTNVWANRLIGDEQEPPDCEWLPGHMGGSYLKRFPDWFVKGRPRPSKGRYCFTTWNYFNKRSPLVSSGLIGPVRLTVEE